MKTVKKIAEGVNYSAVTVGAMSELGEHVLTLAPGVEIQGKVFVGQSLGTTGADMSFQNIPQGGSVGFLHTHKTHEELYVIIKGSGEYQVDGEVFAVSEGSVIRVSPKGRRALRNTGSDNMIMLCVQYKADTFDATDATDGEILADELKW